MSNISMAMEGCGITPPLSPIIYNGKIQRFKNDGDDNKNSYYVAYQNGDLEAGAFGDWKLDIHETFCNKDSEVFTSVEKKDFAIQQSEIRLQCQKEKKERHQHAEIDVNERWSKSYSVDSH